jgi:hypothetical protein
MGSLKVLWDSFAYSSLDLISPDSTSCEFPDSPAGLGISLGFGDISVLDLFELILFSTS